MQAKAVAGLHILSLVASFAEVLVTVVVVVSGVGALEIRRVAHLVMHAARIILLCMVMYITRLHPRGRVARRASFGTYSKYVT